MDKKYLYKGKLYSDDLDDQNLDNWEGYIYELLDLLEQDGTGLEIYPVTFYNIDGETIGTDNDMSDEDVIEAILDYGTEYLEEYKGEQDD